jgi:branched-chain amino acid transport system substrate-binding protein
MKYLVAFTIVLTMIGSIGTVGMAQAPEAIKLGTSISLTGAFSLSAEKWGKMTEVFEKAINSQGGIFVKEFNKKIPVKFIVYDDRSVPATSIQMYERLATVDNVHFFVGPDWSPIGFAASTVAENHKIPMVMANVGSPQIFQRGYKWIFALPMPGIEVWSHRYLDNVVTLQPPPKTIAWIMEDNIYGKDICNNARPKAEGLGLKTVAFEAFRTEVKDFTPIIMKLKPLNPDIVYIAAYEEPLITLMRQIKELDFNAKEFHGTMTTGKVVKALGKTAEYLTGEITWWYGMKTERSDVLTQILKESDIDLRDYIWTVSRLTSYWVMLDAIEKVGSLDRAKIRDYIAATTFSTPIGPVHFEADGHAINYANPTQVQKGDLVITSPPDYATGKKVYPTPPWKERP